MCDHFEMPLPKQKQSILLVVAFAVYLVLLAWVILWKLDIPYVGAAAGLARPIKLIPFLPSGDAAGSAPLEVLANVLLFVPFGFSLGLIAPSLRWWAKAGVFVGVSLLLEVTQYVLSIGSFDVSDVISNTAGGLVGLGLLVLARRRLAASTLVRICLVATALAVVATVIFVVSPLHYAQPHDVIFPLPSGSPRGG